MTGQELVIVAAELLGAERVVVNGEVCGLILVVIELCVE